MRITIKQKEIESGIRMLLVSLGIALTGKTSGISFTASRGEEGMTATIDIDEAPATEVPPPAAPEVQPVTKTVKVVKEAAKAAVKEDAPPAPPPSPAAADREALPTEASNDPAPAEPAVKPASLFA